MGEHRTEHRVHHALDHNAVQISDHKPYHTADHNADYEVTQTEAIFDGIIFDVVRKTVRLPDGKTVPRDVLHMSGAAAVLALLPDGRILFVRQYREGARDMLLEIPAGKIDKGEEPQACAIRELAEETGYSAEKWRFLFRFYPAAAYNDELLYVYLAENLTPGSTQPDDDEFVTLESYDLDSALKMIDDGTIIDAKTIAALLYYARMREG